MFDFKRSSLASLPVFGDVQTHFTQTARTGYIITVNPVIVLGEIETI